MGVSLLTFRTTSNITRARREEYAVSHPLVADNWIPCSAAAYLLEIVFSLANLPN
jgi:hypothetical protein